MVMQNIPEGNPRNGVTITVKAGDNAGKGAAMTADLVRFIPGLSGSRTRPPVLTWTSMRLARTR
jgi:hypothetical protein